MDNQNHFYGHSAVLASAADQRRVRHLRGLLQHGWTATSPIAGMFHDFPKIGTPASKARLLVWSHHSRGWSPRDEEHETTAIGAPFLYLLRLHRIPGAEPAQSAEKRPLIAPQHTTALSRAVTQIGELADYYGDAYGPSTVCLHGDDLANPETVAAWRRAGHDVVSAGTRFDPRGLVRQLTGLRSASQLVTNRLSTLVFYALAAGVPVSIEGSNTLLEGETATTLDWLTRRWPEIHEPSTPFEIKRQLALKELGAEHLREPAELAEIIGWSSRSKTAVAAAEYWTLSPLRKTAMVLGLTRRTEHKAEAKQTGSDHHPSGIAPFFRHPLSHLPSRLPALPDFGQPEPWLRPEDMNR